MTVWIAALGARVLQWVASLGHAAFFFVDLVRFTPAALRRFGLVVGQVHAIGNRSLVIILASGMAVGFVIAIALGKVSFAGIDEVPWVAFVTPLHFGMPVFDLVSIATMCLVMVVVMVESLGMFLALGDLTGRRLSRDDLTRGLRTDGLGTLIGGFLNTFPHTSFSQNVGLVGVTGVKSRWVCVAGGAILMAFGMFPKMALIIASVPPAKSVCSRMFRGHSGCAIVTAFGCCRFIFSRSCTLKISCTMHDPSHRIMSRPVRSLRYAPRCLSGTKRISYPGGTLFRTTSSALPDVTTQSDSAFTLAELLM